MNIYDMNEKELVAYAISLGIKAKISDKKEDTIKKVLEKISIKKEEIIIETPKTVEYEKEPVQILEIPVMPEFDLTPPPRLEDVGLLEVE